MCSGTSRRASKPAWMPGCRVLTRPSRISGKPVRSLTGRASIEASSRARIVPPVEYSSYPSLIRPRARAGSPALLWTERSALLGKDLDCLRQDTVLFDLDACVQRLHGVVRQHGYSGLQEDRAGVDVVGDDVDGAAGDPDAVCKRALHGVHASREGGQQRGVNVENAAGESRREAGAQDPVVAGVDNELDAVFAQPVTHSRVALLPRIEPPLRELAEQEPMLAGKLGRAAAGAVGGHGDHVVPAPDEVPQVGALAACQNAQTDVSGHLTRMRWLPVCSRTRPMTGSPGGG